MEELLKYLQACNELEKLRDRVARLSDLVETLEDISDDNEEVLQAWDCACKSLINAKLQANEVERKVLLMEQDRLLAD